MGSSWYGISLVGTLWLPHTSISQQLTQTDRLAKLAVNRKRSLYSDIISQNYIFVPFACETLGPWSEDSLDTINTLGSKIKQCTDEPRSTLFLIQKLSIILQQSNAASIMGTLPDTGKLNEIYFLL